MARLGLETAIRASGPVTVQEMIALLRKVERLDKALAALLEDSAVIRFYPVREQYLCRCCGDVGASPDDIRHTVTCAAGEARALRKELFGEPK